jgi:RAB protein geranylgeranyltransferase component A
MQDLENITEATGNIIWGTAEKSDRDTQKKEDEERIKEYNRSFVAMIYFVKRALMKKDI